MQNFNMNPAEQLMHPKTIGKIFNFKSFQDHVQLCVIIFDRAYILLNLYHL